MSIIPASRLSSADLAMLGNNTDPADRRPLPKGKRHARRAQLAAINRSLGRIGEQVNRLHRPLLSMPPSPLSHRFAS